MATNPLLVNIFDYPTVVHLHLMNANQLRSEAKNISGNLQTSNLFRSFYVIPTLFEHYNICYSEKQVKGIDQNFYYYSVGTKFRLTAPTQTPPGGLRYLIPKFFSGDVSGDIAEALFAYFLVREMNVSPYCIGHTRPQKRAGYLTPDFIVWDNLFMLSSFLKRKTYKLPVLAEVKGFTGRINSTRISHGLSQLKVIIAGTSLLGILFIAARNENRRGYDAYTVRVRA